MIKNCFRGTALGTPHTSKRAHIQSVSHFRKRSLLWFVLAVLTMLSLGVVNYYYVNMAKTDINAFIEGDRAQTLFVHDLSVYLSERQRLIGVIAREPDQKKLSALIDEHKKLSSVVQEKTNILTASDQPRNKKTVTDSIGGQYQQSVDLHAEIIEFAARQFTSKALQLLPDSNMLHVLLLERIESLMFLERYNKSLVTDNFQEDISNLLFISLFVSGISIIIALLIINRIMKFTSHQKSRLMMALDDLDKSYRALSVAGAELESANRIRMEFIANMSHELRTPMTSIKGALGILNGGMIENIPEEASRLCQIADNNADRLLTLINDVLNFSKLEAGDLELIIEEVNLKDFILRVTKPFDIKAQKKNILLHTNFDQLLPEMIESDPNCLKQILEQLLENAVKFTNAGEINVSVTYIRHLECVKFSVSDTGIGLDETTKSTMFDVFVQGDGSSTRQYGGTGLGLAICQRLTSVLGGEIGAENNTTGEGLTLWFTVPVKISKKRAA